MLCMFGDGATNQGTFGETMNLAALWKLPVVFMVINNQFGMGTALERHSAVTDLSKKAEGFGVPGTQCDGMDVLDTHAVVAEARSMRARGARAAARRGRDLPLPRPLDGRPRGVPHEGGGRGVAQARPDRDVRRSGSWTRGPVDGGPREARRGGGRQGRRGGRVRRQEPVPGPRLALRRRLRLRRAGARAGTRSTSARPTSTAARTSATRRRSRTSSRRRARPTPARAATSGPRTSRTREEADELMPRCATARRSTRRCARRWRRRVRLHHGRGHRRLPGRVQGHQGPARGVRREARARHADLREHDRRHGRRAPRWPGCGRSSRS